MANFWGDLSQGIISGSLFETSTGVTTDANAAGVSVDLASNVANIANAIQIVGSAAGTTPTLTSKVQESTDGTTWTDVTGGGFTVVAAANNTQDVAFKPTKRYVRTTGTVSGTSPVLFAMTLIIAPRRTSPDNDGGFDQAAAAAN